MIIQNNEQTIKETLDSLASLTTRIIVADIGCTDKTADICKNYGADVVKIDCKKDRSIARNQLVNLSDSEWNLQIEPWETIIQGQHELKSLEPGTYRCNVIQKTIITKPIRFWHKKQAIYKYPVFETIKGQGQSTNIYIRATPPDMNENNLKLLEHWKSKNPLAVEPYYYKACILLTQQRWKEFLDIGNYFLFQEKKMTMATTMTRYYMATVHCYIEKNYQKSIDLLMYCLAHRPLMAEFWCLLGDIYYAINEFNKAKCFYENAKILGSRRLNSDEWPFDIVKYKDHPNKMIASCDELFNKGQKLKTISCRNNLI